jgi:hypothetical protein
MAAYFTRTGGSPVFPPSSVVTTSSNYSVKSTDFYIGCNGTGITITLPLGSTVNPGQSFVVKDESGLALVNNVTINPTSPNGIDGNSSVKLYTNYMSLTFLWTGARWSIV